MPDCFSKSEVTDFLNFMKLPDGTPLVSDDMMEYLMVYGFFTAPASTKYHGNYEGGLLEHSYMVTKFLLTLTQDNHLIWRKSRSPSSSRTLRYEGQESWRQGVRCGSERRREESDGHGNQSSDRGSRQAVHR